MTNCPSCGCRISRASRFCPMCGEVIRQDAADARFGVVEEVVRTDPPAPNESLLRSYAGLNWCGAGVIKALKVLAVMLSVVIGVCGVVYGVMLLMDSSLLQGVISLVLGPGVGLLLYVLMSLGIFIYENISFIARQTETQNRISAAQLELVNEMLRVQKEELALARQNSELLKVIDGACFDAVKLAESQNELLDRMNEIQRAGEQKLIAIKAAGEQLTHSFAEYDKNTHSWHSNTRQFAHAIALAVSQLPERIREVLTGESRGEESQQPAEAARLDTGAADETDEDACASGSDQD